MRMITRKSLAAGAAELWRKQYYSSQHDVWNYGEGKRETWEALVALGPNPLPCVVNSIIGNSSWTSCKCDECGSHVEAVIEVGEEPDYESCTAHLCMPCVYKAYDMIISDERKGPTICDCSQNYGGQCKHPEAWHTTGCTPKERSDD